MVEFEDLLCDKCLFRVENEDAIILEDMCDRCREKVLQWLVEIEEEHENILQRWKERKELP
jgi:hypothetical protein